MDSDDDPGWPSLGMVMAFILPGAMLLWARGKRAADGLVSLRAVFLSFSLALVAFGIVIAFIGPLPNGPVVPWIPIVAVAAAASVVAVHIAMQRPLVCDTPAALAGSYRARFFLVVALTESVALLAFVGTFTSGPTWIYYVGATFAVVRLWTTIAPTRSALVADQYALNARGCTTSLVAALRSAPPSSWRQLK